MMPLAPVPAGPLNIPPGAIGGVAPTYQGGVISISLGSQTVILPDGLESMQQEYPTRTVVTQTFSGLTVDSLGPGYPTITLSGHTGWRALVNNLDGLQTFKALLALYQDHMAALVTAPNDVASQLLVINTGDQIAYRCVAQQPMQVTRDQARALLFQFQWTLSVLYDLSEGAGRQIGLTSTERPSQTPNQNSWTALGQVNRTAVAQDLQTSARATIAIPATVPYVVQSGDVAGGLDALIQKWYGTFSQALLSAVQAANPQLAISPLLTAGEVLFMPLPGSIT